MVIPMLLRKEVLVKKVATISLVLIVLRDNKADKVKVVLARPGLDVIELEDG